MISKEHLNVIIVTTDLQLGSKLENLIHLIDGVVFIDQFNNAYYN